MSVTAKIIAMPMPSEKEKAVALEIQRLESNEKNNGVNTTAVDAIIQEHMYKILMIGQALNCSQTEGVELIKSVIISAMATGVSNEIIGRRIVAMYQEQVRLHHAEFLANMKKSGVIEG